MPYEPTRIPNNLKHTYPKDPEVALPTIGRIVYIYFEDNPKEHAAIVAAVPGGRWGAYAIDCLVAMPDGWRTHGAVPHLKDAHPGDTHWDWMPYQKGQAAKTEALQAQLDTLEDGKR